MKGKDQGKSPGDRLVKDEGLKQEGEAGEVESTYPYPAL